jgi:two-component sensor histidine kinase
MVGLLGVSVEITALKREQQRNTVLVRELAHRSKNLLTVVHAIANETLHTGAGPGDFMERFGARLLALSKLQDLVVSGARGGVELRELIKSQLAPFADGDGRLDVEGREMRLKPEAANALGLALHELATNATKYGSLSVAEGKVSVGWGLEPNGQGAIRFRLNWRESGGPAVEPPALRGFGTSVVVHITAGSLNGQATLDFPSEGAVWRIDAPAEIVVE